MSKSRKYVILNKTFPILTSILFVFIYYSYVVELCLFAMTSTTEKVAYLLFYHVFFVSNVVCYFLTTSTCPGRVPEDLHLNATEFRAIELLDSNNIEIDKILRKACLTRGIYTYTRLSNNGIR